MENGMERCIRCKNFNYLLNECSKNHKISCDVCGDFCDCSLGGEGEITTLLDYTFNWRDQVSDTNIVIPKSVICESSNGIITMKPIMQRYVYTSTGWSSIDFPFVWDKNPKLLSENFTEFNDGQCLHCRNSRKCTKADNMMKGCSDFKSIHMQWPVSVDYIIDRARDYGEDTLYHYKFGTVGKASVYHPNGSLEACEAYWLGETVSSLNACILTKMGNKKILTLRTMMEPTLFIPKLNRVVFGSECWWSI